MITTKRLDSANKRYREELQALENKIEPLVKFEFFLDYSSDGHMVVHDSYNAPLDECLNVINSKGDLTFSDYLDLTR